MGRKRPDSGKKTEQNMSKLKGFTLVELLVSLAVLSVLAAVSFTTFASVKRASEIHRKNDEMLRELRSFLARLDVEVSGAVFVKSDKNTLMVSKRKELGTNTTSDLIFTTISPRTFLEPGNRSEIIRVEYETEENGDNKDFIVLKKKIYLNTLLPPESAEPFVYVVRSDFTSFLLRFHSAGKWFDSWDSEKMNGFPDSIELIFSIGGRKFRELFNVYISEM